jgi:hypothetical protein
LHPHFRIVPLNLASFFFAASRHTFILNVQQSATKKCFLCPFLEINFTRKYFFCANLKCISSRHFTYQLVVTSTSTTERMSFPPQQHLSELAQKYTHPTWQDYAVLAGTGKSGYTPIRPIDPGENPREFARIREEDQRQLQRHRFLGFTTQELVDMEAFAPTFQPSFDVEALNPTESFRSFPIHSMLLREKWTHPTNHASPPFLLPGGTGIWKVNNLVL